MADTPLPIFSWLLDESILDQWDKLTHTGRRIVMHFARIEEDQNQDKVILAPDLDFLDAYLVPSQSAKSFLSALVKFVFLTFNHSKFTYMPWMWNPTLHPDIVSFFSSHVHYVPTEPPSFPFGNLIGRIVNLILIFLTKKQQGQDLFKMYNEKYPPCTEIPVSTMKSFNQKIVQFKKKQMKPVIWAQFFHHQRVWVGNLPQKPIRPYSVHIVESSKNLDSKKLIYSTMVLSSEIPTEAQNLDALFKAISELNYLPTIVAMQSGDHATDAQTLLAKLGIETIHWSVCVRPHFDSFLRSLESKSINPSSTWTLQTPSLLDSSDDIDLVRAFYKSCAAYWKAKPWKRIDLTLSVSMPGFQHKSLVSVMGFLGQEIGLGFHQTGVKNEVIGIIFGPQNELPFDELDDIQSQCFEIAEENAYPNTWILENSTRTLDRLSQEQMRWCEAILLALPKLVEGNRRYVGPTTIPIVTSFGSVIVSFSHQTN